jgi:hypothetical protein
VLSEKIFGLVRCPPAEQERVIANQSTGVVAPEWRPLGFKTSVE